MAYFGDCQGSGSVRHQPKEAAKAQYRIGYLSAYLVDHQPFNGTDLLTISALHGGALYFVAAD
jgi:hypothetical protein